VKNTEDIYFILVNPAVPENIGFASRALKTMGFRHLRLVNAVDHLASQAKKTAYGSHDVLVGAEVFGSLADALKDMDLSIATTSTKRQARHDYYSPEKVGDIIKSKGGVAHRVAIVFGSERDGLSKEDIGLCDLVSTIPLSGPYPSLNLAQAVLLYAWELSKALLEKDHMVRQMAKGEGSDQTVLKEKVLEVLEKLNVSRQASLYQRIKDRVMLADSDDTRLMLSFARFLIQRLKLTDKK